ncbi:prepilin-type N-terminal cleavage/methylation domain-containing protein [Caloranaerobacter ferrireducens]|uniref:prepilin-type N-terminal cleavage/methylation domain-containing protein n=1 Tax=Caloranaerobacter ferrireducens TaxID=1323370 RepID=UPI00084D6DAD|nr:prepilin-type N-terminal cleavage/methylation domain-containing protein [Caloranaerobacter ferrireducens]
MWLKNGINKEAGLTLIEVLITISILGIIIIPLSSFFITSAKINKESGDKFKATLIAQKFMEDIKLSDSIMEGQTQYNIENYNVIVNITNITDFSEYESSSFYDTIDYDIKIQIDKDNENYISIYDKNDNLLAKDYINVQAKIDIEMIDSFITVKIFDNNTLLSTINLNNYGNEGELILEILGEMNFVINSKNQTENDLILYFCKSDDLTSNYTFYNLGGKVTRYENILILNNESESNLKGLYQVDVEVRKDGYTLERIKGYKLLDN